MCLFLESSWTRHSRRCSPGIKSSSRQKACQQCVRAKTRCDMERPTCRACQERRLACSYYTSPENQSATQSASHRRPSVDVATHLDLQIPEQRHQELFNGTPTPTELRAETRHTVHFIIRVLKSWPRMMVALDTSLLPPMIHRVQFEHGTPTPFANCSTLVKMWAEHIEGSSRLVHTSISQEVQRLFREHTLYTEEILLSATQSILILLVILLFDSRMIPSPSAAESTKLLIIMWQVKHHLAETGLFLDCEMQHKLPTWREWAFVSAKRRNILALHHVEWAWSVLHGYPELLCTELGPLPAPAAKCLWQECRESEWNRVYEAWLLRWKDGFFAMAELFSTRSSDELDSRTERWLSEADEFGMMVMAEVGAVGISA